MVDTSSDTHPKPERLRYQIAWERRGDALKYILPFAVNPGDRFDILCRVSSCEQERNGNLEAQEVNLRREVESRGGFVCNVHSFTASGWIDPRSIPLLDAIRSARKNGSILLAASTDRLVRHQWFSSNEAGKRNAQATEHDLAMLSLHADGVPLMTFLDPNATPAEVASLRIRWGIAAKREAQYLSREDIRALFQELVRQLADTGMKSFQIRQQLERDYGQEIRNVPSENTIRNWLQTPAT